MKCDYQIIIKRGSICSKKLGLETPMFIRIFVVNGTMRVFVFVFFIQQLTFKAIPYGIHDPLQEKTFLFEEKMVIMYKISTNKCN